MKLGLLVVFILFKLFLETETNEEEETVQNRVFNGYPVQTAQYPYAARIRTFKGNYTYVCTGSLISHYYVLTAAHCVASPPDRITVTLGIDSIPDPDGLTITCSQCWTIHYNYTLTPTSGKRYTAYDIALLNLPMRVHFNERISPIELPTYRDTQFDMVGASGTVVGWGRTNVIENDEVVERFATNLMAAQAKVLDQEICRMIYSVTHHYFDSETEFCTLHVKSGTCAGDSGGPFIINRKVFGIVKGGTVFNRLTMENNKMCVPNYADDYLSITKFLEWIEDNSDITIGVNQNTMG